MAANETEFVVSWTLNTRLAFVKPLPDHMEVYCKKCGKFMRTPYQTKCCVKHVCKDCHNSLMAVIYGKRCPHCSSTKYDAFEDRFYQRNLRILEVRCINEGCRWSGKLEDLSAHLNYREKKDEFRRYEGCDYTKIKCKHDACHYQYLERRSLKDHEEKCRHRPYTCPYCSVHNDTFELVELHYNTKCSKFPVPCSNGDHVGFKIERGKLKKHLDKVCPFQPIACEFKWAGCNDRPKRKDTDEHNTSNQQKHLLLLAKACGELKKENEALKKDSEALKQRLDQLTESRVDRLDHTVYGDLPVTGDERNPVCVEGNGIPVFFFSNNREYRMSVKYSRKRQIIFSAHRDHDLKFKVYKGMRKVMPDVKKIMLKNDQGRKIIFEGSKLVKVDCKNNEEQEIYAAMPDHDQGDFVYIIEVS